MNTESIQQRNTNSHKLDSRKPGLNLPIRCGVLLATLCLALAITPHAYGTITITNLNDHGPGSLRQAIADAAPGDTIDFAVTGTITLTNSELLITNNLTITNPSPLTLTVSGNNSNRVFNVQSNAIVNVLGLTVANGLVTESNLGGGGFLNYGELAISNCVITSNNILPTLNPMSGGGGDFQQINTAAGTLHSLSECLSSPRRWHP
jgi:hypothetical protein